MLQIALVAFGDEQVRLCCFLIDGETVERDEADVFRCFAVNWDSLC